jgi:thioredoxin-dependent peroxiredoxin
MTEVKRIVTSHGNPLTLLGNDVKVGDLAPAFTVLAADLSPVPFSKYSGKIVVISSVLSLDTSVCDVETRRFNTEATKLDDDVAVLTLSMDLPFAQKRWCGAAGISRVDVYSDYRDASFGNAYGVLIKELRLLTRCVFIIDRKGIIRYKQLVPETSHEPDYADVIANIKMLL